MAICKNSILKSVLLLCFLPLLVLTSCYQVDTKDVLDLSGRWEFYSEKDNKWFPARVPGNIHTDLFANELIPNPFNDTNSDKLEWISNTYWKYRNTFAIPQELLNSNAELVFEGIDTYAKIYINGIELANTNNMFRKWVFPLNDSLLVEGTNTIELVFTPSSIQNNLKESEGHYAIPNNSTLTRKAPYQYGWDWAPKMETCGIYKKVYLNFWKKLIIRDLKIEQKSLTDSLAVLNALIELESENYYNGSVKIFSPESAFDTVVQDLEIFEGKHYYPIEFEIKNPRLWWCNGLGESNLYNVSVELSTKFRHVKENAKIGLRTIELETNEDKSGQEFYFKLNGERIFAKGANWVPAEYFSGQNSYSNYLELLKMAKNANFNMLRVWGGGIYENDEFYNICDSLGIMIWQDFMFACAFYPLDDSIVSNINEEIDYQVNRLYNHPSIVMWCGNNEISNAWFDWGWQKEYNMSYSDSLRIWNDYDTLFHRIIPNQIHKFDGSRKYIPSSPFFGWGRKQSLTHGDSHYWGVWWGESEFSTFFDKTGRFMSEYGFQAMPSFSSLRKFIDKDSLYLFSQSLKTHQKHQRGQEIIDTYLKRDNDLYADISVEDYVYLSQILQADGIQMAYDAHLSAMPYCMGSLVWQFNDCWPVTSWSMVDYYKQPKALYYSSKRSFENVFISSYLHKDSLNINIINHFNYDIASNIIVDLISFSGDTLASDTSSLIAIKKRASKLNLSSLSNDSILAVKNLAFLQIRMFDDEKAELLSERSLVLLPNKDLLLPKAEPEFISEKGDDYWIINIKSNVFVKGLFMWIDGDEGYFTDNFFNVQPNKQKEIRFYPKNNERINELRINYKTINDFVNIKK